MAIRTWFLGVMCLFLASISGCALWHELKPYRMHRLNRGTPPHLDPEFSQRTPWEHHIGRSPNDSPTTPILRAQNP